MCPQWMISFEASTNLQSCQLSAVSSQLSVCYLETRASVSLPPLLLKVAGSLRTSAFPNHERARDGTRVRLQNPSQSGGIVPIRCRLSGNSLRQCSRRLKPRTSASDSSGHITRLVEKRYLTYIRRELEHAPCPRLSSF